MARHKDRTTAESKPPQRARRLRVFAQLGQNGEYGNFRDVYLESALMPHWEVDLYDFQVTCVRVVDLIRFAESIPIQVVYEPPGNMEEYFRRGRRDDVQSLFT